MGNLDLAIETCGKQCLSWKLSLKKKLPSWNSISFLHKQTITQQKNNPTIFFIAVNDTWKTTQPSPSHATKYDQITFCLATHVCL